MKKNQRKLALKTESVKILTKEELERAIGGGELSLLGCGNKSANQYNC